MAKQEPSGVRAEVGCLPSLGARMLRARALLLLSDLVVAHAHVEGPLCHALLRLLDALVQALDAHTPTDDGFGQSRVEMGASGEGHEVRDGCSVFTRGTAERATQLRTLLAVQENLRFLSTRAQEGEYGESGAARCAERVQQPSPTLAGRLVASGLAATHQAQLSSSTLAF
eukprot:5463955-Pleurochrysis_carterae.AAC.1